jgi:hypothetical protein
MALALQSGNNREFQVAVTDVFSSVSGFLLSVSLSVDTGQSCVPGRRKSLGLVWVAVLEGWFKPINLQVGKVVPASSLNATQRKSGDRVRLPNLQIDVSTIGSHILN